MKVKWSNFVSFIDLIEEETKDYIVIFNSLNRAKFLIKKNDLDLINKYLKEGIIEDKKIKDIIPELICDDIIVDVNTDETRMMDEARYDHYNKFNGSYIYFSPTMGCNFKCPYCIVTETIHNGTETATIMTDEMVKKTAQWIVDYTIEIGGKGILIEFFGGEPTLAMDKNILLLKTIEELKPEAFFLRATMITNGYLFDEEKIKNLKDYGFTGVQITVDGPARIHDQRRIGINEEKTFTTIIHNMDKYLAMGLSINARINIDLDNAPYVTELIEVYVDKGFNRNNKFSISLAPVDPIEDGKDGGHNSESFKYWENIYKVLLEHGFNTEMWTTFCGAYGKNMISIAPDGSFYKCPSYTAFKSEKAGNLIDNEFYDKYYYYLDLDIPHRCKVCNWAGICAGGCLYVKELSGMGDRFCMKETYDSLVYSYIRGKYNKDAVKNLLTVQKKGISKPL